LNASSSDRSIPLLRVLRRSRENGGADCFFRGPFRIFADGKRMNEHPGLQALLDELVSDASCLDRQGELLQKSPKARAWKVREGRDCFFVKEYLEARGWSRIKDLARPSRALRAWREARRWSSAGLSVPVPYLCVERCRPFPSRKSYFLSEYVEGATKFSSLWRELDEEGKNDLLRGAAAAIGRIHRAGGIHGDLKWNNILVRGDETIFCDHDASRLHRRFDGRKAFKELQRFLLDLRRKGGSDGQARLVLQCWQSALERLPDSLKSMIGGPDWN